MLCAAQRPAPVGDIAASLRCDRSNVSHLVDRAGTPTGRTDGRVKLVALSADGQDLVERFVTTLGARFEALVAEWPDDRRDEARTTLKRSPRPSRRAATSRSSQAPRRPPPTGFPSAARSDEPDTGGPAECHGAKAHDHYGEGQRQSAAR